MPQFTRRTIIAAVATLQSVGHSGMSRFMLECGLEGSEADGGGSLEDRANRIIRFLLQNPNLANEDGENLTDATVRELVQRAIKNAGEASAWNPSPFEGRYPELTRALRRDGFEIGNGELRRGLPEVLDLPAADDEVHGLLKEYGFSVPMGHLDQAIKNHGDGNWAAANSQLRTFVEGLFDELAAHLAPDASKLPIAGHPRRMWLAAQDPPFFLKELNEWDGQGKGFLEGFLRRLHPQGAHPGLSDEADSTFRLHLVLLVARTMLSRLRARVG